MEKTDTVQESAADGYRVSVVIPAFNVESCIAEAIDSVRGQRRPPDEIIVVDDGSTDGTAAVVAGYAPAVRYIPQNNAGPSAARNRGIEEAGGEWIAFLDSDDVWLPDKLAVELDILGRNPDLVWVCSNHLLQFFGEDAPFPRIDPALAENYLGVGDTFESFLQAIDRGIGWDPTAFTVRKDVLQEVGRFRVGLNYAEDLDLCLRIAHRYPRVGFAKELLAVHQVDRPDGLCQRQSIPEKMQILKRIYVENASECSDEVALGHLTSSFERIVHDNLRVLLLANQSSELKNLLKLFDDILDRSYVAKMRLLTLLPLEVRKRAYLKAEWRIRGLTN